MTQDKIVSLKEIATFTSGGTPSKKNPAFYTNGTIPWITGADINDSRSISARTNVTEDAIAKSAATAMPAGTIALVTRTSVGKVGIFTQRTAFSQDITGITPGPEVDSTYLVHFLESQAHLLKRESRGATIKGVAREIVGNLPLALPSIAEQRRIAAILNKADAIRTKRRSLLAHIDSLERSSFLEAFGDLDARSHVTDALLESKGAIRTGPFGSQLLHEEFVDEGVAVLGLDNVVGNDFKWAKRRFVTPAKYAELSRYTVHPGDVLISIMGTVGRCVVVPEGIPASINTKHICAITLDRSVAQPTFVRAAFLWHPATRRYLAHETKGAIMAGLNMGIIKRMPLPLPPLGAQIQFADKVAAIHAERDRVATALETDEELFTALRHRAFLGEL